MNKLIQSMTQSRIKPGGGALAALTLLLGLIFGSVQAQALVTTPVFTDAQGRMWGNPWDPDLVNKFWSEQNAVFPAGVGAVFASLADIISAADTSNDAASLTNTEIENFMQKLGFFQNCAGDSAGRCFARLSDNSSAYVRGDPNMTSFSYPGSPLPTNDNRFDLVDTPYVTIGALWYIPKKVPEPSSLIFIGLGLLCALGLRYRRQ